ncbi:hypothetical protein [Mycolicibacterium palauense]|uniref:hypothetical protein n=1 Tax=Mycolicibacterium palauense TaxID=2034511 RepID=UPI001FE66724|nr:hypothetical protein [Mycolicibacterium palauense]
MRFSVDGEQTHVSAPAPAYPMQLILGVFDFPGQRDPGVSSTARFTPRLHVTRVRVTQPTPA